MADDKKTEKEKPPETDMPSEEEQRKRFEYSEGQLELISGGKKPKNDDKVIE